MNISRIHQLGIVLMLALSSLNFAQYGYLIIGTGNPDGIYLPVGSAVSRIINTSDVGTRATLFTTEGSVDNIRGLLFQDYSLAVVQSDVLYQAANGEGDFASNPFPELRAIIGLHQEPLHLVCREDAAVETFADLAGKRVNIGPAGSGQNSTVMAIFEATNMATSSMTLSTERARAAVDSLHEGTIDCFFYSVGIGAETIQYAARTTDVTLVPLNGGIFDTLVETTPYYTYTTIPANTYAGNNQEIRTFGTRAVLATTTDYQVGTIYRISNALIQNLDVLSQSHLALSNLSEADYLETSITLHEGAARALREAGMLR